MSDVRGWMRGESSWPAMDSYHEMVGGDRMNRSFNPLNWKLGGGLLDWFQGSERELETRLHRVTPDVIWWVVQQVR